MQTETIAAAVNEYQDKMFGEARPGNRGYREIGAHAWHAGLAFGNAVNVQHQAPGWISVKDRLPVGDGVECLCYWNGHIYIDHFYQSGDDAGEPVWEGKLTPWYWMPRLPDPKVDPSFLAELAAQRATVAQAA